MLAARCATEAQIKIQRELLACRERGVRFVRYRVFPYPCRDGRLAIFSAELSDGSDIDCLCFLDWPIDPHNFDEEATIIAAWQMSETRH